MSKEYIYSSEDHQSLINDDVPEVWSENDQSSLQYFDANNTTLNETYASALGTNETQYLSILDNTEENLDDLHNLTINTPSNATTSSSFTQGDAENVLSTNSDDDDSEIVVFTMEGSDELYGLQLSHDADGSIKKYQFKFRSTEQGQLEPIPETVTLLSNENLNIKQENSSDPEYPVNISNIKIENNVVDDIVEVEEPLINNIENILITKVRTAESESEVLPINNNAESIKLEEINLEEEISEDETLCEEPTKPEEVWMRIEKTLEPVEKVNSVDIDTNVQTLQEATKDVQNEVKFYVVYHEKENVKTLTDKNLNILQSSKSEKIHPRSVLKTTVNKLKNEKKEADIPPDCDMFHKRFAKNKDAMRAKHFHNFLKRTTITHAPIRNQRQPRKQEIKPIDERSREEIIVQEVVISSNGFIESTGKINNECSTIVELSDSEAESVEYTKTLRSGRTFGPCEKNIIEINSDIEETTKSGPLKRCRGRPSKTSCKIDTTKTITGGKIIELICPHCTKTFPSQNSLNTHIKHHNLEKRLKSRISTMNSMKSSSSNVSISKTTQYNYQCEICEERFINKILLQRHKCKKIITEKQRKFNCAVCLKTFGDVVMLNIHKKGHLKANLMNTTCSVKVTPRRKPISPKRKIVDLKATTTFKCNECSKICDSALTLSMHQKTHKKFLCNSCLASFTSKMLLDLHVRCNCVKFKTTNNSRASLMLQDKKISTHQQSPRKSLNNKSILGVKLECDKCLLKFNTFRNLYTHKVEKHGLDTPNKSLILTKPKKGLYKPRPVFGGIPANDRLKKAYANIRQKLAESSTNNLRID